VQIPSDDGVEIEPELIELAVDKPVKRSNNPPPLPWRRLGGGALALDQSGPGPRFQFATTPTDEWTT
jgi:hypothetical protein